MHSGALQLQIYLSISEKEFMVDRQHRAMARLSESFV